MNLSRADFDYHLVVAAGAIDKLLDADEIVLIQPVNDKAIGREQLENRAFLDRLP